MVIASGGLVGTFGFTLVWAALGRFPGQSGAADYWVEIGRVKLEGWQIYACAAAALGTAVALIWLGMVARAENGSNR